MAILFLFCLASIFTLIYTVRMFWQWLHTPKQELKLIEKLKLSVSGILAFAADTFGIGSFVINVAFAKLFKTFPDQQIPALVNGVQVLPGLFISLLYIQHIHIDVITLVTLVTATSLGGIIGSRFISKLTTQMTRLIMIVCFLIIIITLVCHHIHWLPDGGATIYLRGQKLAIGFIAMFFCGALTVSGVGLFISVQAVMFMLNMSAVVVFPIMTLAGAIQQPLSSMVFLQKRQIPLQKAMWIMIPGCITIFVLIPFMFSLVVDWLHKALLCILVFNTIAIGRDFLKDFFKQNRLSKKLQSANF